MNFHHLARCKPARQLSNSKPGTSQAHIRGKIRHLSTTSASDSHESRVTNARKALREAGYLDPRYYWEQPIVWGDHDSFQHVNNVRYVRFFESSRIHWMRYLGDRIGVGDDLIRGKGVSLILKSIEVQYRRPVTYPDTLLIAHRPVKAPLPSSSSPSPSIHTPLSSSTASSPNPAPHVDPSILYLRASAYSLTQQAFVAHANEASVWYDYTVWRKCVPEERYGRAVWDGSSDEETRSG